MTKIYTECGKTINTDTIVTARLIDEVSKPVNILWIIFWLIIFLPIGLLVIYISFTRKSYFVEVRRGSTYEIVELEYHEFSKLKPYISERSYSTNTSKYY